MGGNWVMGGHRPWKDDWNSHKMMLVLVGVGHSMQLALLHAAVPFLLLCYAVV